jgi:hypothetical protein
MTPRQLDVLAAWWVAGGSVKRAAAILGMREQTAKNHLYQARREAGGRSTLQLAIDNIELIKLRHINLPSATLAEAVSR